MLSSNHNNLLKVRKQSLWVMGIFVQAWSVFYLIPSVPLRTWTWGEKMEIRPREEWRPEAYPQNPQETHMWLCTSAIFTVLGGLDRKAPWGSLVRWSAGSVHSIERPCLKREWLRKTTNLNKGLHTHALTHMKTCIHTVGGAISFRGWGLRVIHRHFQRPGEHF